MWFDDMSSNHFLLRYPALVLGLNKDILSLHLLNHLHGEHDAHRRLLENNLVVQD